MSIDPNTRRSRRAVLAAAAGGAAAAASAQLLRPPVAAAAYSLQAEATNVTTSGTTIQGGFFNTLTVTASGAGANAIVATATSSANAISAQADTYCGVIASTDSGWGVQGMAYTSGTGVEGWSDTGIGVRGASNSATGILGSVGPVHPGVPLDVALCGVVAVPTQIGIQATGRVVFPNRSGSRSVAKGKSSVSFSVPGVKSGNFAIATLGASRTGRWVAAVVCATNRITIYLNGTLSASTPVSWLVLG
jgi:hypothetical protein